MKLIAAFALAAATLSGTAALAAPATVYTAVPAAPTTRSGFITRSTAWRLQNGSFVAGQAPERPAVLCELVARQVGALTSFTAGDKAFDADQLAKCNAKAKKA
jgi:hypothetical protein